MTTTTPVSLLVTLACLAGLLLVPAASGQGKGQRFAQNFEEFAEQDKKKYPPQGCTLFIGSANIAEWQWLAADMKPIPVVNRGFGGSTMRDALAVVDRFVIPYQPRQVLVYEGDNDTAERVPAKRILVQFQAFAKRVHKALPRTKIFFMAIKPSPKRAKFGKRVLDTNEKIAAYCRKTKWLGYIDTYSILLNEKGKPREGFYTDGVRLNRKPYFLWTDIVKPVLQADLGQKPTPLNAPKVKVKLTELAPLFFPPGVSRKQGREIIQLIDMITGNKDGKEVTGAIEELLKIGHPVIPELINRIIVLDYKKKDPVVTGCILSHLLRQLCGGRGMPYQLGHGQKRKSWGWQNRQAIAWNRYAAYQWYTAWKDYGPVKATWEKNIPTK